LREAIAYGIIAPSGRAKNFAVGMLDEVEEPEKPVTT
jgi:hypothetical protein